LNFVGINIRDEEGKARKYIKDFGLRYPIGSDNNDSIAKTYGVTGTPNTFFIDSDGRIFRIRRGAMQEADLLKIINELLKK